jgi:hypothetical protein
MLTTPCLKKSMLVLRKNLRNSLLRNNFMRALMTLFKELRNQLGKS